MSSPPRKKVMTDLDIVNMSKEDLLKIIAEKDEKLAEVAKHAPDFSVRGSMKPFTKQWCSVSSASIPITHVEENLQVYTVHFEKLDDNLIPMHTVASSNFTKEGNLLTDRVSSETTIGESLTTIIKTMNKFLDDMLRIESEISVRLWQNNFNAAKRVSADGCIFLGDGPTIISCCEWKKPFITSKDTFSETNLMELGIVGEVYHQLRAVEASHGRNVLALLSCFNQTRICWLNNPMAFNLAGSNGLNSELEPLDCLASKEFELYCSQEIRCDQDDFKEYIFSFLWKCIKSAKYKKFDSNQVPVFTASKFSYFPNDKLLAESHVKYNWSSLFKESDVLIVKREFPIGGDGYAMHVQPGKNKGDKITPLIAEHGVGYVAKIFWEEKMRYVSYGTWL